MLTPYQTEKTNNLLTSMTFSARSTIEKNRKKEECYFQNKMCVSSQKFRMKKEEGATVDCRPFCHLPSLSGLTRLSFVGSKAVSTEEVQTIGKYS